MATRTAAEVAASYWDRVQARDWPAVRALLAPEVVLEWPASGERFRGPEALVAVNSEYPEGWSIEVVRAVPGPDGGTAVTEVVVPHEGVGVFAVASFWTVRHGLVVALREYWVECGGEEPPSWRSGWAERYDGRPASALG
jgi:ketosteroid isomerase-like protein